MQASPNPNTYDGVSLDVMALSRISVWIKHQLIDVTQLVFHDCINLENPQE